MPRIFDNLQPDSSLLPALQETLSRSARADFCIGYLNLRGWGGLAPYVDRWGPDEGQCRVLVGMQRLPHEELRASLSLLRRSSRMDNEKAIRIKEELAREFRQQLTMGAPTNEDERILQQLAAQIRAGKVVVKIFCRQPLHAKLYLLFRNDPINPVVGYLGSSNLTLAGLSGQGELNIDVLDHDAALKLEKWFEARWNDRISMDITAELLEIIEQSWARETLIPPYHIYLKMAYHLSHEARAGLAQFRIPNIFGDRLFDFQSAAVKIAAHHLNKRDGVLIGDVVGLGKTLMATAVARIFEDDYGMETLILCPKNLVPMWEDYRQKYGLRGKVLSISSVLEELPDLRRHRLVIIDESHNLRNREGRRYRAIQEYVRANDSKCILLSATPYNKSYVDLSNQLRIFVEDDQDIGIRPERLLREIGETEFTRRHQASTRTLAAFDQSEHPDDWRDLMRLFMVRRTRSFVHDNYADTDPETGRKFLTYEDGRRMFFPTRVPKTVKFAIDESNPDDQYAQLYSRNVVEVVRELSLPRYGLGNYLDGSPVSPLTDAERKQTQDLSRAGKRLIGFCRTNLFKRLESSGKSFLQSIERHILRNYVFLHAIENGLPLPLGTQDAQMLDSRFTDADKAAPDTDGAQEQDGSEDIVRGDIRTAAEFQARARETYAAYSDRYKSRFKWLRSDLFLDTLEDDLRSDANDLLDLVRTYGAWDPDRDAKLDALHTLLTQTLADRKVLIFSQFADTVHYLEAQLERRGVHAMASVTGDSDDPTDLARRFSPESNGGRRDVQPGNEIRVLVTTDVLSEGQNLQDCSTVVNYDLPWAIIRLIQRAGRVDRIGQNAERIHCYSFLPADGVERIINLRSRVQTRLEENAEVVGADEAFFEGQDAPGAIVDLYNERSGILDGDTDGEVDLASHAYQIWKNAIAADPRLATRIPSLPDVVFSSRRRASIDQRPEGVLVFTRSAEGNDALAYIGRDGRSFTDSQTEILAAAECSPDTPAQPRHASHHRLVDVGVDHIVKQEKRVGGQLGRPSSPRYRTYHRLSAYAQKRLPDSDSTRQSIDIDSLRRAIDDIYQHPLRQSAADTLNRQLRSGIDDIQLADIVLSLYEEERLCQTGQRTPEDHEPQIICSLGLFDSE